MGLKDIFYKASLDYAWMSSWDSSHFEQLTPLRLIVDDGHSLPRFCDHYTPEGSYVL